MALLGNEVCALVAMDELRVIGKAGKIPWYIPEDMKRVAALTTGHTVLMGRKTFDSLPKKFKPLPNRKNVVLTRNPECSLPDGVEAFSSLEEYTNALQSGRSQIQTKKLWILGGSEIYKLSLSLWDAVYLTAVKGQHEGDAYFPEFENHFELVSSEEHEGYSFKYYRRNK